MSSDSPVHHSYNHPQKPTAANAYGGDYPMPNPQPTSLQEQMPGAEFLQNNPLFNVGLNAFERRMTDLPATFVNMLPNEMRRSLSSIKNYFAVDQVYVMKKLSLLLFPFRIRNWSLDYSADEPIPPRFDTNAPDYYIPLMSAITYVLVAGIVLGTQNRFTPEQLGMHASSILIWNIIENCLLWFLFFIFNIQSKLRTLDLIAYCGYKYVGMIIALSSYLITHSLLIYRCTLLYIGISISYFLMKCLRLQILPDIGGSQAHNSNGNTRRIYLLILIIVLQPLFIWYLTRHLIVS